MCQRKTKQKREFEPILKANGYREIRSNGSHFIYSNGNNKITVNSYFASIANKYLSDKGSTILGESVNTELVDGLVKVNAKIKTTEGTWKTFSAKIDADGNMFERKFRTITKGVDKLETALKNFSRETSPALTYQETLDKANEIRDKLQLGGEYSIKVDSNELVTITKKLSDVNSTATSVTQTFKSAEDAIQNFGQSASNSAEKT
ncbi:MAG: type II toxin-antitoxin system HicA family toxin, partial [Clostridia bacterium]|nr:type II toxin-antitoxin system HicA family toxin [Clostridia bacterium]